MVNTRSGTKAKGTKTRSGTKTSGTRTSGKSVASGKSGYAVKREQHQQDTERLRMQVEDLLHRTQQQALVNASNVGGHDDEDS